MPDKDITVMVKTLTEQNKAMIEMMKTQSDKSLAEIQQRSS